MNSVLTNLSQGLQLKLEKAGGDYKLALVNDSGQYYYYDYSPSHNSPKKVRYGFIVVRCQQHIVMT